MSGCINGQAGSQFCEDCKHRKECEAMEARLDREEERYWKRMEKAEAKYNKMLKNQRNNRRKFFNDLIQ
jgi:hypothetical protein